MKLTNVRFKRAVVAFDDERTPVTHRFQNAELGLTIEIRQTEHRVFVYGAREKDGIARHEGESQGHWVHGKHELYSYLTREIFRVAAELSVKPHHCWPFVEQLPVFTENGVDVTEALKLAGPIKDLLARGAPPTEVMTSLGVDRATIEFVLGKKLPEQRRSVEDDGGW